MQLNEILAKTSCKFQKAFLFFIHKKVVYRFC